MAGGQTVMCPRGYYYSTRGNQPVTHRTGAERFLTKWRKDRGNCHTCRTENRKMRGLHCSSILSIGQRGIGAQKDCPPGLSSGASSAAGQGHQPAHISVSEL